MVANLYRLVARARELSTDSDTGPRRTDVKYFRLNLLAILALLITPISAAAQGNPCPRFAAGSTVTNPPALFSSSGVLTVNLAYNTATDADGRTLYCFTTPDGTESPTLHVHPGDTVDVNVTNLVPAGVPSNSMQMGTNALEACGPSFTMDASSVNLHYH